jgi:hypothetical protein
MTNDKHRAFSEEMARTLRQREFPDTDECVYLNHAACSPLPALAARAVERHVAIRPRPVSRRAP